jgi:Na+-transporting NADH:ubiquinone oxidoreductase subunit NqrB
MAKTVQQADALNRAAELARSGQFEDWTAIADQLRRECYTQVDEALGETSVRDQIDLACGRARNA